MSGVAVLLILLIYSIVYFEISFCQNNCQASSLIHTEKTGFLSYPIELFNYSGKPNHNDNDLYKCNASVINNPIFNCVSTTKECPINSNDLDVMSLKSQSWNYQHSLCHLSNKKERHKTKRLIVFGGSFTGGRSAYGCFCLESLGNKCPYINKSRLDEDDLTDSDCRWGDHVGKWFGNIYPNSNYYILRRGGVTSAAMLEQFEHRLYEVNVTSLNSNDIVILDHSVNDATSLKLENQDESYEDLKLGLEAFIQKLYLFNDGSGLPTIILLEFWPLNYYSLNSHIISKYNYSDIYKNVAKAYNLTLWSYRDVVWSNSIQRYDQYSIDLLQLHDNANLRNPPWFIHLYYADLITGLLRREIDNCHIDPNKHTIKVIPMNQSNFISPYNVDLKLHCLASTQILLLHSYSFLPNPIHHSKIIGSYYSIPNSSFQVYEDSRLKSGWIDEMDLNNNDNDILNYNTSLFFTFNNKKNILSLKAWIIKIFYFRSYNRVGIFDIYLCNHYLNTIDSLWEYRTSETKLYKYRIDPTLEVSNYCMNQNPAIIEIKHKYINDKYNDIREKQKVKIVTVEVCESTM